MDKRSSIRMAAGLIMLMVLLSVPTVGALDGKQGHSTNGDYASGDDATDQETGCQTPEPPVSGHPGPRAREDSREGIFIPEKAYSGANQLSGGLDFGDVDNDGYMETVITSFSNSTMLARFDREEGRFVTSDIWRDGPGMSLWDAKIADVDPDHPGNEILVVGISKNLTMLYFEGGRWMARTLYTSPEPIYGVEAADLTDEWLGPEIGLTDWTTRNMTILHREGSTWVNESVHCNDSLVRIASGDVDPSNPKWEFVASGGNGSLVKVLRTNHTWVATTLWRDNSMLLNVAVGDFYPLHQGVEIVTVGFSGNVTMVTGGQDTEVFVMWNSTNSLEGVSVGDLHPERDGNEVLVSGYRRNAVLISYKPETGWEQSVIYTETDEELELNGALVADMDPTSPGLEGLVTALRAGATILRYEDWNMKVYTSIPKLVTTPNSTVSFRIIPEPYGGFDDPIHLFLSQGSGYTGITAYFEETTITVDDVGLLTATVFEDTTNPQSMVGNYTFNVTVTGGGLVRYLDFTLQVKLPDQYDFTVSVPKDHLTITVGSEGIFTVRYDRGSPHLVLSLVDVPQGFSCSLSREVLYSEESAQLTVAVGPEAVIGRHSFKVVATAPNGANRTTTISVSVVETPALEMTILSWNYKPKEPEHDDLVTFTVEFRFDSGWPASNVTISLMVDEDIEASDIIESVDGPDRQKIQFTWKAREGRHAASIQMNHGNQSQEYPLTGDAKFSVEPQTVFELTTGTRLVVWAILIVLAGVATAVVWRGLQRTKDDI